MNAGDVFVSHAGRDAELSQRLVQQLESHGFGCWISLRDIPAGSDYAAAIIEGLRGARAFVLVLTPDANISPQVHREVERAAGYHIPIFPVIIGNFSMDPSIEYFVSNTQQVHGSLDGIAGIADQLVASLHARMRRDNGQAAAPVALVPTASEGAESREEEPPEVRDLIAREEDLEVLATILDSRRMAVVVGIPGVGKTQVAAMVRRRWQADARLVFWRRLTPVDDLSTVLRELALFMRAQGIAESSDLLVRGASDAAIVAAVARALEQLSCLVILDNLEACPSERLGDFLRGQLDVRGASRFLVTTREVPTWITERERVHGLVYVHELGGFSHEETAAFLEGVVQLHFSDAAVELIYDRTKGHPLLLDLLSSQIVSYGLDEEDLAESLPDLSWDLDQFLLANIYRGLNETERHLLGYLSVSLMPLSATDLEMVLEGGESRASVMTGLRSLERRRLIQRVKVAYLIHSVVRDFVYGQSRNVSEMHSRMADLLRSRPRQNGRVVQESCRHLTLAGRESEADNDVVDNFALLWTGGYRGWTRDAVEAVIDHAQRGHEWAVALRAHLLLGRLHLEACDWESVETTYAEARGLAERLGDDLSRAWIDNNGAEVTVRRGDLSAGLRAYDHATSYLRGIGNDSDATLTQLNVGAALARFRHLSESDEIQRACLNGFLQLGRWDLVTKAHSLGGLLRLETGDLTSAASLCDEDERLCTEIGDPNGIARVLNNRCIVLAHLGRIDDAETAVRHSLELNVDQADEHAVAQGQGNLAAVLAAQGRHREASAALVAAYYAFDRIGDQISLQELAFIDGLMPEEVRLNQLAPLRSNVLRDYRASKSTDIQPRFLWNVSYGYLP